MRRRTLAILSVGVSLLLPAMALGYYSPEAERFPEAKERYGEALTERYLRLWEEVGPEQAGANLVIEGAPKAQVAESADRLYLWLNPPAPEPEPVTSEPVAEETTTTYSAPPAASSGGCPSYMAGEADSPSDVNPASGAAGCYQVIPSTAAAMGSACADVNAPSCLAAICAAQGNDAWVAADPCKAKLE
jgi:hypothetical protein